jgi:hypothetical protein
LNGTGAYTGLPAGFISYYTITWLCMGESGPRRPPFSFCRGCDIQRLALLCASHQYFAGASEQLAQCQLFAGFRSASAGFVLRRCDVWTGRVIHNDLQIFAALKGERNNLRGAGDTVRMLSAVKAADKQDFGR